MAVLVRWAGMRLRPWMAWAGSVLAGLLLFVGAAFVLVETDAVDAVPFKVFTLALVLLFAAAACAVPRGLGFLAGLGLGLGLLWALMEWADLWSHGPTYEGPGEGLAVFALLLYGVPGTAIGIALRRALAWLHPGPAPS